MPIKLKLPTFSGDNLEWDRFYTLFESILKDATYLNDSQKSAHFIECMSDSKAKHIAQRTAVTGTYSDTVGALVEMYRQPKVFFSRHI